MSGRVLLLFVIVNILCSFVTFVSSQCDCVSQGNGTCRGDIKIDGSFLGFSCLNGTTTMIGNFEIDESSIDNIPPLSVMHIEGTLNIWYNNNLKNLSGFSNLVSVTTLNIWSNDNLTNIDGLANIVSISDVLDFRSNEVLNIGSFSFPQLRSVNGTIRLSSSVTPSFTGFPALTHVGNLILDSNSILTTIDAFHNLMTISGVLSISQNHLLTNINGFENVVTIGDGIEFKVDELLNNISTFSKLTQVYDNIEIHECHSLQDLAFLSTATRLSTISIMYNDRMTSLRGLSQVQHINGSVDIAFNPNLTSVAGLSSVKSLQGFFNISNNPALVNVSLSSLSAIYSDFRIINNTALRQLNGLDKLTSVFNLYINDNPLLENINALSKVVDISGAEVEINRNANLTTLDGFCGVKSVAFELDLSIEGNPLVQCVPTNLPSIFSCPCVNVSCPCCSSGACQNEITTVQIIPSQTNFTFVSDAVVPIFGRKLNSNNNDSDIEIGSVTIKSNTLSQDDVLLIEHSGDNVFNTSALEDIAQGKVVSPIISVSLASGISEFGSNDSVSIRLVCSKSKNIGLFYIDEMDGTWKQESIAQVLSAGGDEVIVQGFTSHFTNFAVLITKNDDDDDEGDGEPGNEDGATSDGGNDDLPSGALAGIIIGCVVFAIIVVVVVVVVAIVITKVLQSQKNTSSANSGMVNFNTDVEADEAL